MKSKRDWNRDFVRNKHQEAEEIKKMRKKLGMRPLELKTKRCLKCDSEFRTNDSRNNHLCIACNNFIKAHNKEGV